MRGPLGRLAHLPSARYDGRSISEVPVKVAHSLRSLKKRHKDCQIVRRRGRVYVINKTNPRFKARQGSAKKK